jgi:glycosyltransferase involved in cell wall biosynthesis
VAPYLSRASVTVIPLRSGGGTRLKILEAMAAGLPVVTTCVGAEGLELASGVEAVVSDSMAELASATVQLLGDSERAIALAAAGRARVEEDYGWSAIGRRLAVALAGTD